MAIARIYEQARQTPDRAAVVCNGVTHSYADFARQIEGARQYLSQYQLPAGCVAVVSVDSLYDEWVVGFALRSLGVTTISALRAAEASKFGLRDIQCLVTARAETRGEWDALASGSRWVHVQIPSAFDGCPDVARLPAIAQVAKGHGGHIMRTSGTTGDHKMVLRDAATEALAIPLHAEINEISDRSIVYVANFGLWTAGGYRWPLIAWSVGATVVIHQGDDIHVPLSRYDMTHIFTTPSMLSWMLRASAGVVRRNDNTRLLVTGGAMTKTLLGAAQRFLTRRVYSVLASTEALTLAVTPLDTPADLLWHRIHPSRQVEVVDEADRVLGPGQEGLIRVRIIDGLTGYLDDAKATREFFRHGYFYPGDLGLFGDDGRLSMRGRASDVVNVLGHKIATAPIERALEDRLGVDGVCVVSLRGNGGDEEIHLVIEGQRRIPANELHAAANIELGVIKRVPVQVNFVEKLPRNQNGKVQRLVLKQQLMLAQDKRPATAPAVDDATGKRT